MYARMYIQIKGTNYTAIGLTPSLINEACFIDLRVNFTLSGILIPIPVHSKRIFSIQNSVYRTAVPNLVQPVTQ